MTEPKRKMDNYGPEDMAIPTWTLLQKTGGDWAKSQGGRPGQFYNPSSDEIADELNIVIVDILSGRAKWGDEISDAGPVCASLDAKSNTSINGDDCNRCLDRIDTPWVVDAEKRRKMCCLNYTILGIDVNNYMPCLIRAHGISALPTRQLLTQLKLNRALRGEYYRAIVNIKTQEKKTKYGGAFALHPRIIELITDQAKAEELRTESCRLLSAPILLPEGERPEEEGEVFAFTPEGRPIYSEEEKNRLIAATTGEPPTEIRKPKPRKEEVDKRELDFDF